MAHSLSAKKRVRQNARRRTLNRSRKSQVKTQIKHLETTIDEGKATEAQEQLRLLSQEAGQSGVHEHDAQEDRGPEEIPPGQEAQRPEGKAEGLTRTASGHSFSAVRL